MDDERPDNVTTGQDGPDSGAGRPAPAGGSHRFLATLGKVLAGLTLVAAVVAVAMVWRSGLAPIWWLVGGAVVALALAAAVGLSLWRTQPDRHPVRFGLLTGLSVVLIAASLVLSHVMVALTDFTNGIQPTTAATVRYDVIALKTHSPDIASLAGQAVGQLEGDPNLDLVRAELNRLVQVNLVDLADPGLLAELVQDGSVAGAVINDAYLSLYEENLPDFYDAIWILHSFDIVPVGPTRSPTWSPTPAPASASAPFVLYISGVDSYSYSGRSDVNILAVVNPGSGRILLVSTPRDYYVQLHGTTGLKDKLTHAGIYGVEMSVETLQDLYQIPIDYWLRINFGSVVRLVDAVGGIEVYSDHAFTSSHQHYPFVQGWNHLDGDHALAFARERYSFAGGDRVRGQNQERIIEALVRRFSDPTILLRYGSILDSLQDAFLTSTPGDVITGLVNHQLSQRVDWQIESISVNGSDAMEPTYSMGNQRLYVMVPDLATVQAARDHIAQVLAG
ncbi:MAG: LCP family protein [Propionibacteriaceae bacterium]|jgi:LCP family protein required for cell wall assembly|nr:LCP family protein [Propionibacteriaceae bacterium]